MQPEYPALDETQEEYDLQLQSIIMANPWLA